MPTKNTESKQEFSYYRNLFLIIGAIAVALQVASLGPLRDSFWGFHLLAFVPGFVAPMLWMFLALSALWLIRGGPGGDALFQRLNDNKILSTVVLAVVLTALFWVFRSQQDLLGDALPLKLDLPTGNGFHPRQPLTMWLQKQLHGAVQGVFDGEGVTPETVVHRTVALGSILCGFIYAFVACALARLLVRGDGGATKGAVWLAAALLLTQGYVLLFFGYVENYTIYTLFVALYLFTSLRYLKGRLSLSVVALVLVVATGLHLATLSLYVSFLFLVLWGFLRSGRRMDTVIALGVTALAMFVLNWAFAQLSPDYSLLEGWKMMRSVATKTQGGGAGITYMFSAVHLRDFANEHFLIGPLATYLFLPAAVYGAVRGSFRKAPAIFLTLASLVYLAGSWAMSEPLLGYARDWDLFAPAGVCYTAAGIYFLTDHVQGELQRRKLLVFAVVLSLVQLVPWVWITHSEERTVDRFKTLPLGAGRTGVVLGNYYMRTGRQEQAVEWFQNSLKENRVNSNAYAFLGVILLDRGQYDEAVGALERAVYYRPDKEGFRAYYIDALIRSRRCNDAADNLVWMSTRRPEIIEYWHSMGDSLISQGCADRLPEVYGPIVQYIEDRITSEEPNAEFHIALGVMYGKMKRGEDSIRNFGTALELRPDNPAVLFNMGTALMQMNRFGEARPYFQRFIEVGGNHPYVNVARRYLQTGGAPLSEQQGP